MKLKCDDGIVREFAVAHCDGDRLPDGTRADGDSEAFCLHCGLMFGVHDTHILKPEFRKHKCRGGVAQWT